MKEKQVLFRIDKTQGTYKNPEVFYCAEKMSRETQSLWRKTSQYESAHTKSAEELPNRVSVIVIGGGMAGILTSYQLKQRGIDSIVLERGEIGRSCSANTTAKITSLHGVIYQKIAKVYGKDRAIQYYQSQQQAISDYKRIIEDCGIECDYEMKSHVMYAVDNLNKIEREFTEIGELGIPAEWIDSTPLPFQIQGGILFPNQAQFHPLRFLDQLIERLQVFTQCQATRIDADGTVEVNHHYEVKAEAVVIATHYPIINSKGLYFTRLDQERSYVVALSQQGGFDIRNMYIDENEEGHTFRPYKDMLIMGVGNHRSGKKRLPDYYKELEAEANRWFPNAKVEYHWSNQDCMSVDQIPYIGAYSKKLSNFYVATGFNQWGMSSSMVSANVISELIATGQSEYEKLYSPSRLQFSGTGSFIENGAVSVAHLTKQLLHRKEEELSSIVQGGAGIVKLDGQVVGVYKDENDRLHVIDTKCPHLGCQLAWNPNEKTWDCPCHGSRFDIDGHLIDDPAQKDLNRACCIKK